MSKSIRSAGLAIIMAMIGLATAAQQNINYVQSWDILRPGIPSISAAAGLSSPYDAAKATQFFDGIGRKVQTVAMQQTPMQKDLVSYNVYDPLGRETTKYLPYAASTSDGGYKTTAAQDQLTFNTAQFPNEQYFYSQASMEPSPLGRPANIYAPGTNWVGSGRPTTVQYLSNTVSDSVRFWTVPFAQGSIPTSPKTYAPGTLYKKVAIDESKDTVAEYTDLMGRTVLKKVQGGAITGPAHVGWLCTYYVYDTLGDLRFVVSPQAVNLINGAWTISMGVANELCYRYEYDQRNRMVVKKVPGSGEQWMVYDLRDRLVMSQDSLQRAAGKWLTSTYDSLDRMVQATLLVNANNRSYNQGLAYGSITYPSLTGATYELLKTVYYDDYSWVATVTGGAIGSTMDVSNTSNGSYFITGYNASPIYAQPVTPNYQTRGVATGGMDEVLGSNGTQYLYSETFFDDRGRPIQKQATNVTGGRDETTTQYDFTGKALRELLQHQKNGNQAQSHTILTKMDYDQAFRPRHIWKNIDNAPSDQLIDSMQYNELGQLSAKYLGNNVDSLIYTYNIRGWLNAINPGYVAGTTNHFFGMELGYDKTTSVAPGNTYSPQYNGNIAGTVWKTAGSGVNRNYSFAYDQANRLSSASFGQYNGSSFGLTSTAPNFSVGSLSYDANGNIQTMNQYGFVVGGGNSNLIDQLNYTYQANSNKLSQVTDGANNATSQLGDFHYNPTTKQATDYSYDGNGNLTLDNNKAIGYIHYDYLNLPDSIVFNTSTGSSKGYIKYVYDAGGTKLRKLTVDNVGSKQTLTTYINGIVYQATSPVGGSGTDTLQFIAHEEGRVRWAFQKFTTGATGYSYQYDFFEKDHLGNTREVLTQESDTTNYLASMEGAYRTTESQLFANIASTSYAWTSVPGYSTIPPNKLYLITKAFNDSVSKVDYNGTTGQTTGPSLLLKVMGGDSISIGVQSYYNTNTVRTTNSSLNNVLSSLVSGLLSTPTGASEGALSTLSSTSGPVYGALNSVLNLDTGSTGSVVYPKAYLNWLFLDDQFNYVPSLSGAAPAANSINPAGVLNLITPSAMKITQNGYLYVWVSNETQGWDVFFDNLFAHYRQGPVLEESAYYPFGLAMAGISDKAVKANYSENKYRYNGKELQNKEFSDGSGLETYDFGARMQDPQLGRFYVIDPMASKFFSLSPYSYDGNNPIKNIEIDGKYFVSLHYIMTNDALLKYGIGIGNASDLAHYASVYADHPSGAALAASNASYGYATTLGYWPNSSLYSNTRNSQNTTWTASGQDPSNPENINYNVWHSMRSSWEAEQYEKGMSGGISAEQAMYRGMQFGWDNIFSSAKNSKLKDMKIGTQAIEEWGQGVHALQDAYAHGGRADVGLSHIIDDRMEVNKDDAVRITESAVLTHLLISGDFETLNGRSIQNANGSISITTTGMSIEQISQVMDAARKYLEYNKNKN